MKDTLSKIENEIDKLKNDSDTVNVCLTKKDLRLIRDSLIMEDAILEASYTLLKKYY